MVKLQTASYIHSFFQRFDLAIAVGFIYIFCKYVFYSNFCCQGNFLETLRVRTEKAGQRNYTKNQRWRTDHTFGYFEVITSVLPNFIDSYFQWTDEVIPYNYLSTICGYINSLWFFFTSIIWVIVLNVGAQMCWGERSKN